MTDLALYHLQKILAPLYEGIDVSEYAGLIQHPLISRELAMHLAQVAVSLLPQLAALDALLQGSRAALHVAVKDVVQRYLGAASLDDVAADLWAKSTSQMKFFPFSIAPSLPPSLAIYTLPLSQTLDSKLLVRI